MQKYIFAQQNVRKNAFLHHKMQLQEKPIGVKNREVIWIEIKNAIQKMKKFL